MLHSKNINRNHQEAVSGGARRIGLLSILGLVSSIGIGLVGAQATHATNCTDSGASCVAVQFGQPVGDRTVNPSSNIYSATQFYLPVSINITHGAGYAVDYSVKVYGSGSALTDTTNANNSIPSVLQNTSYNDLGKNGSEWGMRWNFGDKLEDTYTDYRPIPGSSSDAAAVVVADGKMDKNTSSLTKQLTLGFAVAVDGNQASGSYSNTVTVAVVASPKDARTLFDISTMQEMTPEICARTTTPTTKTISSSLDINVGSDGTTPYTDLIDTTGKYQGNGAYVPQRELTDTRDGKKYTIRKLADGNCWMVSNLEFDLVPTASKDASTGTAPTDTYSTTGEDKLTGSQIILTNKDTDLNTIREWTPAIAAELYGEAGTVYRTQRNAGQGELTGVVSVAKAAPWAQDGTDGLRSFSSTAGFSGDPYSTKVADTPAFSIASTGEPWQKFGNLYNWTAATLGSGTSLTVHGESAKDSICPKGWKLPYDSGNDSFSNLLKAYSLPATNTTNVPARVNQIANFPLNFMRTGIYNYDGNIRFQKADGNWWGATRLSSGMSKGMYTSLNHIHVNNGSYAGLGTALRCVAHKE